MNTLISSHLHSCLMKYQVLQQTCQHVSQGRVFVQLQSLLWSPEPSSSSPARPPPPPLCQALPVSQVKQQKTAQGHPFYELHAQQGQRQLRMNLPLLSSLPALIPLSPIAIYSNGAGWSHRICPWEEGDHGPHSSTAARVFSPRNWAHTVLL